MDNARERTLKAISRKMKKVDIRVRIDWIREK